MTAPKMKPARQPAPSELESVIHDEHEAMTKWRSKKPRDGHEWLALNEAIAGVPPEQDKLIHASLSPDEHAELARAGEQREQAVAETAEKVEKPKQSRWPTHQAHHGVAGADRAELRPRPDRSKRL